MEVDEATTPDEFVALAVLAALVNPLLGNGSRMRCSDGTAVALRRLTADARIK